MSLLRISKNACEKENVILGMDVYWIVSVHSKSFCHYGKFLLAGHSWVQSTLGVTMVDSVDRKTRSRMMSKIRHKDTKPEMIVRRLIHREGYRYRLHDKRLPGKPDLVFRQRSKVIFVHGCFWHLHENCKKSRPPKSRQDFWLPKLEANRERDDRNITRLKEMGWEVLVIWECELDETNRLLAKIKEFLNN